VWFLCRIRQPKLLWQFDDVVVTHLSWLSAMLHVDVFNSNSPDVQLHQATFLIDSCTTVVAFFERSLSVSITLYCVIYTGISLYTVSYSNHHFKSNVFLEYSVSDALTERFPSTFNTVRISLNIHACKRCKRFSYEPNTVAKHLQQNPQQTCLKNLDCGRSRRGETEQIL